MKKISIFLVLAIMLICNGCGYSYNENYVPVEKPHLYWKTENAIVTDIDYRHWYASGHHYQCDITVHNNEYNLEKTFHLINNDAKECEKLREGDEVQVQINTLKMDSTGEIVQRYINNIK